MVSQSSGQVLTSETDNMRYAVSYCVFGFPNATGIDSSPCATSTACGNLDVSMEHGIQDPSQTTAYSYCSAGTGAARDSANFERCIPCLAAEGKTKYLVNCRCPGISL